MKSWQVHQIGAPADALRITETPATDTPGPDQVKVEVTAVALGFPDLLLVQGLYHEKPSLPFTIGGEAAGVVRVPAAGGRFRAGDRVIVTPGAVSQGLLAQELILDEAALLPVPDAMSDSEAAALFVAYQTSYMALFRRGQLAPGEVLLVHGASGGVGSAAIQLGKARGATVIATAKGTSKVSVCQRLGADHVIDTEHDDFVQHVRDLTAGAGANVIFDPVGGDVFDRSRRCVAIEGRIVVVGFASGVIPQLPVNHALLNNYAVVGFRTWPFRGDPEYRAEVHAHLCEMYASGAIQPLVEQIPFDSVIDGLERMAARTVAGRLVVKVTTEGDL